MINRFIFSILETLSHTGMDLKYFIETYIFVFARNIVARPYGFEVLLLIQVFSQ